MSWVRCIITSTAANGARRLREKALHHVTRSIRRRLSTPTRKPAEATVNATSAPPSSGKAKPAFWRRWASAYERSLETRPIFTKSVTGGILFGLGDFLGQHLSGEAKANGFDTPRWARAMAFGGIFYPLPAHLHYNFLEAMVKRMGVSKASTPFVKTFVEQFVYWSYLSNAYYHAVLGALQGMTAHQVYDRVADTLWDTLKAQWAFWIPAQLINFKYVPVRHQLNFVLVVSLGWTSFLSVAFPPAKTTPDVVTDEPKDINANNSSNNA
mmetsp:Transcript_11087/g.22039  ORF Transcript_11087/g.22039 Transcript_11087/m.22039 type:complete len:268 (+) Transcript_11087:131-934(+)|eukprot:CAMPEP_0167784302 /NCGR_PEP_ID=MMETSP0111_2-20121227/7559_1 /TAXON_ID=91324 /ORGANISM="Lotharella globosa, Strain CCCM811" /LENGTH=267 /DNA_ID=CAMNT_0007675353 /DNA_START=80 /DNA_END=883 /DNA_ORIENTATION=+